MDTFNRTVLTIAIILLVISLIFIGVSLYATQSDALWPPDPSECPDYWNVTENGCEPNSSLGKHNNSGTGACPSRKPLTRNVQMGGEAARTKACIWAKSCGVHWDGISKLC